MRQHVWEALGVFEVPYEAVWLHICTLAVRGPAHTTPALFLCGLVRTVTCKSSNV